MQHPFPPSQSEGCSATVTGSLKGRRTWVRGDLCGPAVYRRANAIFARVRINAPAPRRGLRLPATFQFVSSGELFKVHTGLRAKAFLTGKRHRDWLGHLDAPWPCITASVNAACARFCAARPDSGGCYRRWRFHAAQSKSASNH